MFSTGLVIQFNSASQYVLKTTADTARQDAAVAAADEKVALQKAKRKAKADLKNK